MILSMGYQIKLFLLTVLIGLISGFVYDLIKVTRRIIKHSNFIVQLEDFLYWIIISAATFFVLLNKNSGQVRGFCILGALFGMILYAFILSKSVVKLLYSIINFVIKVSINTIKIVLTPIKIMLKILNIPYSFLKFYFDKIYLATKKSLHASNHYAKIRSKKLLNNIKIIFKKI